MRKSFLEKRQQRLMAKRDEMKKTALASESVDEVRSINAKIEEINEELDEIAEELAAIAEDEKRAAAVPAGSQPVNGAIVASYNAQVVQTRSDDNPLGSMEYRKAFRDYIQRGVAIPEEMRSQLNDYRATLPADMRDAMPISTADTAPAIPLTVMNEVINTVRKRYGNLYRKVRKLSVAGGVDIPVGALEADFSWISESTAAPRQGIGTLDTISFRYNVAEIRIAQTFLSALLTLDAFEAKITEVIALGYLKLMDKGIVAGTGNGQMLGILNDARVTNVVTMTAAQINNWTAWRKNFFARLPLGYRNGEFIFPVGTVDAYLETMADANNNPIYRQATGLEVNSGDALNPNGRFFGRDISLVEPDIIADFDTASANDVIGIYWQPEEYAINENFGFTMRRYYDEERNQWVTKALCVADGKILNPNGVWIIKKA